MKKTFLATLLLCFSYPSIKATYNYNGYKNCALGAALLYATIKMFEETLKDTGYRHLFSKQKVNVFEQELKEDSNGLLSERAIKFWGKIQYLSTISEVWWRELLALPITAFLGYWATQYLKNGIREIRTAK